MSPCEAEVWTMTLADAPDLRGLLAPEERERAARCLHEPTRRQFIAARAGLRLILSHRLGVAPQSIALAVTGNGKPVLVGGRLKFNVSHSHDLALIAVADAEVGVDVEQIRARDTWTDMARRYFTSQEADRLRDLDSFYAVWTRKEAFLKALGLGLAHGLERFAVSVPPDEPARILHIDGDAAAAARWSLLHLRPAEGYVGALAIKGPVRLTERRWQW